MCRHVLAGDLVALGDDTDGRFRVSDEIVRLDCGKDAIDGAIQFLIADARVGVPVHAIERQEIDGQPDRGRLAFDRQRGRALGEIVSTDEFDRDYDPETDEQYTNCAPWHGQRVDEKPDWRYGARGADKLRDCLCRTALQSSTPSC